MCHNTDTMWHIENRISRYTSLTTTKSIPKFSALRLKRTKQDTEHGERKTKGSHFSTGPTTSSRHSKKKLKALILVLALLQVVGTVKTKN